MVAYGSLAIGNVAIGGCSVGDVALGAQAIFPLGKTVPLSAEIWAQFCRSVQGLGFGYRALTDFFQNRSQIKLKGAGPSLRSCSFCSFITAF